MKHLNSKTSLFLGDFATMSTEQVRAWMAKEFQVATSEIEPYQVLAGCLDEGSYEGSVWFLLRDRQSGEFFEVHGGHCSCYGFEDQFSPEPTTLKYLQSEKFGISCFYGLVSEFRTFLKTL